MPLRLSAGIRLARLRSDGKRLSWVRLCWLHVLELVLVLVLVLVLGWAVRFFLGVGAAGARVGGRLCWVGVGFGIDFVFT